MRFPGLYILRQLNHRLLLPQIQQVEFSQDLFHQDRLLYDPCRNRIRNRADAAVLVHHIQSMWKWWVRSIRHGNDEFWYGHESVFFSVRPLFFLQPTSLCEKINFLNVLQKYQPFNLANTLKGEEVSG